MKSLRMLPALALFLAIATSSAFGQSVGNYAPVVRTTGITFNSISGTGNSYASWRNGTSLDDNRSAATPIGFPFYFDGQVVTQFSVSTNGYMDFSSSTAIGTGTGAYGYSNGMFSTASGTLLAIAPLYDDLTVPTAGTLGGNMKYLTTGSPGSRVLTAEWIGLEVFGNAGPDLNFQVKLYEATGVIEIIYGTMNPSTATYSYTCGINGPTMSATPTVAELLTQQTVNTATFSNTPQSALAVVPAANSMYAFTPPNVTPAAPISLTFSAVTQTGMTVGWTDNSTDETSFGVLRSTDNVTFTAVGNLTSTTPGTTGTTYSLAQSGLTPGITYYFQVTANTEGRGSIPLTGSQSTNPPGSITSIAATGNWSAPSTWSTGTVPTALDNVTIANGTTVTIDVAAVCFNLTVGQGASGVLQFEATTSRTMTVSGDVTIVAGGTLQSALSGTQTLHALSLSGNLTNNGTLDLSTNANTAGATLTFTGASNATLAGSGPITDLRALTINKGTSPASVLDVAPSNLTVRGVSTDAAGFLTITNGTFKLSGTYTVTNRVFSSSAYSIPSTGAFWLNNPNFVVAGQNASPTNNGLLRITQGTFTVGTASGNAMGAGTGASFIIEGGTMNVAGRLLTSSAVTYNQSGGTVNVCTVANASSSSGSFDLSSTSTSFTMSGGTIVLVQASTATTPLDYRVSAANPNISGGTLQIGTGTTVTTFNFRIAGAMPNVVIDNTTNGKTAILFANATAYLNTTINLTSTLNLNAFIYLQVGPLFTNNGTLNATAIGSRLYFIGTGSALAGAPGPATDGSELPLAPPAALPPVAVAQTYTGSGGVTAPALDGLSIDNPAGLTISAALPGTLPTIRVNLFRGVLTNSNKVTVGSGSGSAVTQIGSAGQTAIGGSYDTAPAFNVGTGSYTLLYAQEGAPRTTGFEVPSPGRSANFATISNANGVTLAGGNLTITNGLTLTAGLFNTDASNLLTLANSVATPPAGSATSYVNGPLAIEFNVASPVDRAYAIGRGGAFRPLVLKQVNTGGVAQTYQTEVVASPAGGTPLPPLQQLDPVRYWTVTNTSNLNSTARVNLTFGPDDGVPILSSVRVAQANAPAGNYASLGGVTTGSPSNGTVESNINLTPGDNFFTLGLQDLPYVWDGGAGTPYWGDALNWNPNTVPGPTDNVSLTLPSTTAIDVNGNFACNDLVVGSNILLTVVATNVLTVNGNVTHSGSSTTSIGSGALVSAGPIVLSGGTINVTTGSITANGSFTLSGATLNMGAGTLEVKGAFTVSSGVFNAGTSTTIFSGAAAQAIGGGVTHYNLVFRNGGTGVAKILTAANTFTVANDLTVESTAQLALSAATATTVSSAGNLYYSGLTGGANIASLTFNLTGSGKSIAGASAKSAPPAVLPNLDKVRVVEIDFLTDPALARHSGAALDGEKPAVVLENTYELRQAEVEKLLATTDPEARLVVNLDDMTIVRNPARFAKLLVPPSTFEMALTIASNAVYTLADNIAIGTGRLITVTGRLNCATYTISGAGGISVASGTNPAGTLGIGVATGGVGATVLTAGASTYTDGSNIDYYAAGDQTIHTTSHPAGAMLYTSGSGVKTLDGNKTLTGSSASALTKGVLVVGAGTTFADAGYTLSFTTTGWANVLVNGTYSSTGAGGLSYESGPTLSNIVPVDGTTFGNLTVNYGSSTSSLYMNGTGTVNASFRKIVFGGAAGTGTGGGTLTLNKTGITNVTVTDSVSIRPATASNTGGGFGGTSATTGTVILRGPLVSTSTASTQPIMNSTGTNTLVMSGPAAQVIHLTAATTPVTMFTGSTLKIDNAAGVTLASATARTYGIGGTLNLTNGNITTGGNTLLIASTGSVARTSGHVVGNLAKNFSSLGLARTMEIGSASAYTPVDVAFASISTAGNLTATTVDGDHPAIAASPILAAKSVNRYYTLANGGIVFTTANATFNWVAGDLDSGTDPTTFIAGKYTSPNWTFPTVGTRTPTSLQVTGLTALSDFAFGNQPSFSIDDVTVAEGDAGTTPATFTVTLSDASTQIVTVQVATADNTARVADLDYVAVPLTTLTFNPGGPLTQAVPVLVNGDTKYELDETYYVNLTNAANAAIADNQGLGTIQNDDVPPAISITDVAVAEGDASPKTGKKLATAIFTVSLSNPSKQTVTVEYATADGTATVADGDYVAIPTTILTFLPGDPTSQSIAVTVNGDTKYELDETYFVNLTNAVNATIADPQGQGTIQNDDPVPSVAIDDVAVVEGNAGTALATFTVTLSGAAQPVVTVDYATADGTASAAGGDYVAVAPPQTVTFNPGDPLTQNVSVTVNGDLLNEIDETFFVNLTNAVNATIADNQGLGTIQNDDPLPALTIDDLTVVEGNSGTTTALFTVTLAPASGQTVTVDYTTSDGTATVADLDYVPVLLPQTMTFNPGGPLTQTVSVTVNGDLYYEADETFFVDLAAATNATLGDNQGQGTIQNDDTPGSLIRVPLDYPTIQQAINAANTFGGSRIEVAAGTYPENLVIDRQLVLVGAGMGATFVNAASPGIIVTASAVTISSLTLTGSGTDRGILVDHTGGTINLLTVSSVEIRNFECGVWFEDSVPPLNGGIGHVIEGSRIHDNLLGNPLYRGAGVNGSYTSGLVVRGTAIHDNGGPGIYLRGASGTVLANAAGLGNYFYRNAGLAVVLDQNPANVAAAFNYWGADPEAVIHHQVDDPPEGLVTFANPVVATVYVDPVFQKKAFTTTFTADVKIDMHSIPQTLRQYNMVLTWDPTLLNFVSAAAGPYLAGGAGPNGTSFFHYGADGSRTFTEAILGAATGATGNGTLFTITFTTETTEGISPLDLPVAIVLRDMENPFNDVPNGTVDGSVEVDGTPPANVTAFNATVGHNKISVTWVDPTDTDFVTGGAVEIWRAGWDRIAGPPTQSAYPEYDDWPSDEIPVLPATRTAAAADPDWSLVTTVAPATLGYVDASFTDLTRNVYYYAAFTRDDVANYAATVPGVTHDRATSYYLGDFTRGAGDPLFGPPYGAPGAGPVVNFNDLAAFSSVFATTDGGAGWNPQGDIGPSDDNSSFGIPTTDNVIDFEDLILFAINFTNVFPLAPPGGPVDIAIVEPPLMQLALPAEMNGEFGLDVTIDPRGTTLQGARLEVVFDPETVELVAVQAGELFAGGGTDGFFAGRELGPEPGRIELNGAALGPQQATTAPGRLARITMRRLAAGDPELAIVAFDLRNPRNAALPGEIGGSTAGIGDPPASPVLPTAFELAGNHPNPFNPATTIRFALPEPASVRLRIWNARGELVRVLIDQSLPAGYHDVTWNGRDDRGGTLASGVYLYRLDAGSFTASRKMLLVR